MIRKSAVAWTGQPIRPWNKTLSKRNLQNRSQTLIVLHVTDEFSAVTDKLSKKNIPLTSSE